jgi:hypothetical protein
MITFFIPHLYSVEIGAFYRYPVFLFWGQSFGIGEKLAVAMKFGSFRIPPKLRRY